MKVTTLPLIAAAWAMAAQAYAGPVRIYVLAPENTDASSPDATASSPVVDAPVATMRWGLAAAGAAQSVPQPMIEMVEGIHIHDEEWNSVAARKHRCSGGARMKAIAFANWLREKVGLEPIAPPPHLRFPHGRPMLHRPEHVHGDSVRVSPFFHGASQSSGHEAEGNVAIEGAPRFHHFHHHPHHRHGHGRPSSFASRIQRALMTLGPWEGRLVAFIIGCGIGSLLRMFYVLCVLAYRSFQTRKDDDDEVEVIFAEVEELLPPKYLDDEKVAPADEKVST